MVMREIFLDIGELGWSFYLRKTITQRTMYVVEIKNLLILVAGWQKQKIQI